MAINHLKTKVELIPETSYISSVHQSMNDVQHSIRRTVPISSPVRKR